MSEEKKITYEEAIENQSKLFKEYQKIERKINNIKLHLEKEHSFICSENKEEKKIYLNISKDEKEYIFKALTTLLEKKKEYIESQLENGKVIIKSIIAKV